MKFIAGGDSIIYQGNQGNPDDPNMMTVEVASLGNPSIISDWRTGGCSDYDAASVPGLDLAVMEQARRTPVPSGTSPNLFTVLPRPLPTGHVWLWPMTVRQ